jgi:hypothetical protein
VPLQIFTRDLLCYTEKNMAWDQLPGVSPRVELPDFSFTQVTLCVTFVPK